MISHILSSSIVTNMNNKVERPNKINSVRDINIENLISITFFTTNYFKDYISQIITAIVCICLVFHPIQFK
ncbi:hypothetical protein RB653_006714 [Dictyostelium firmibasis]|uniref:Uncharacterized protein n=1 Tax=Dictyostelium firmibasis TaxID=79012 RepID=A0AAN7YNC8_9MYCE